MRCVRCKAYVNPYMRFVDGGRKMQARRPELGWLWVGQREREATRPAWWAPTRGPNCSATAGHNGALMSSRLQCNFCGNVGEVPPDYFCHLGPDGQRRDKFERPELCKG